MTAVRHHPSEATLFAYAAGTLGEGLSLVIASHLVFCPECRANIAEAEAIGGSLLEDLAPETLDQSSRDKALQLIGRPAPQPGEPALAPRAIIDPSVPAPLARYLGKGLTALDWRLVVPGLRQVEVLPQEKLNGGNLRMLRIAPGKALPRHGHTGTELTLILRGSYTDELGQFMRGDVAETDEDIVHEPVSDREEDCYCLIATEGPLKFESPIARLFQRFTGI